MIPVSASVLGIHMRIKAEESFSILATKFDAFVLDVWGVLMDGATPYPGAKDCLQELRDAGKRIILLSNAPRRASSVAERLEFIGMDPSLYDHILTSGEASRLALAERTDPGMAALGKSYFYIGPDRDQNLLQGLEYSCTENLDAADFILTTGVVDDSDKLDRYEPCLQIAKKNNVPMICANPDNVVVRQNGDQVICAGAIANRYQEIGGAAHYFGKPHQTFYETCLKQLKGIARNRILAVGDTLHTDIKGAQDVGLTTALVLGGVLAKRLGITWGESAASGRLEKLCAEQSIFPDFALPTFIW